MTPSLYLPSLVFWLCFVMMPSRSFAEFVGDAKHLSPLFGEYTDTSKVREHGVHVKRKRGARHSFSKRCNASQHSRGGNAPESSQYSPDANPPATHVSKKWGLAWPNGDASYLANFARPKVHYLYTWSPYLPSAAPELGLEGIPMLWGWDQADDFKNVVVRGYATKVLGMNEPNEPSQSNLSPEDGVSLWKLYIDPLKYEGYYLISPACTNDQAGLDWMQSFVEGCTGCTVDAVAFHFYGTDPDAFVTHARTLHETYNKPIWVTEFADQNFSGSGGQASMSDIYAFQSAIIDFVENTPWMEAAFPFGLMYDMQGVNEGNSLLGPDGWPTSLAYNYFG